MQLQYKAEARRDIFGAGMWGREHRRKMSATLNLKSYWGSQKDPPPVVRNKKLKFEGNDKTENKYV